LNSNKFRPRYFASCEDEPPDDLMKPHMDLPKDIDIKPEQDRNQESVKLMSRLSNGKATKTEQEYFLVIDEVLYYLSSADSDNPKLRLYIPEELELMVIKQYHDFLGHMGLDKSNDTMRHKYYFPIMYKKLYVYIEVDIPPYPFAKITLDLSVPYPETLLGNKYIVSFIDVYSGWPEAFSVPNKCADNIVQLLLDDIFPIYGCPLEIVTDNGSENVKKV